MKPVRSARGPNTQTGGSDPSFGGFQPPKIFGVAPDHPWASMIVFCPRAVRGADRL
jgi:hypothetical protein